MQELLVAQSIPVARRTVEIHLVLPNNVIDATPESVDIEAPGVIVGFDIGVTLYGVPAGGGLRASSIDDVMLSVEGSDLVDHLTRRGERDGSVQGRLFVSARALDLSRRMLMVNVPQRATLRIGARWKQFILGTPLTEAALVSVAVLYNLNNDIGNT